MRRTPGTDGPPQGGAGAPPAAASPSVAAAGGGTGHPDGPLAVQASDDFRKLRRAFRSFAFPVTVAFCAWYLLYVLLAVYARDFMGTKVLGNVNLGFVFGVLQFVTTFLIAWAYARYARTHIDPAATTVRENMDRAEAAARTGGAAPGGEVR